MKHLMLLSISLGLLQMAVAEPVEWTVEQSRHELKEQKELQIVDVRTSEEFKEGHLEGARLLPWTDADFTSRVRKELDPAKPVFVYCRSGKRSDEAGKAIEKMEFKKVYVLKGGVLAWEKDGGKLIKPE